MHNHISYPAYEKFKLKNGLTVYLMEQHEVPVINVSVILPAGAIYDGEKAGLASLTATALKHGTKNYTKEKLDEELDFNGQALVHLLLKNQPVFLQEWRQRIRTKY